MEPVCPVCQEPVPAVFFEHHVEQCLEEQERSPETDMGRLHELAAIRGGPLFTGSGGRWQAATLDPPPLPSIHSRRCVVVLCKRACQ